MAESHKVIYCDCAYSNRMASETRQAVLAGLTRAGVVFEAVPDLCKLAADQALCLKDWTEGNALTVIGCFPRTVRWLFHAGGVPLAESFELTCLNMHTQSPEAIIEAVLAKCEEMEREHVARVLEATDGHKSRSAEILGVSRPRLDRMIERYGLGPLVPGRGGEPED